MGSIRWTAEAIRWLTKIESHIAEDNVAAAAKVIRGIYDNVQLLRTFPELGYVLDSSRPSIRVLLYGHYQIVYRTVKDGIEVIGVFHGAMELHRYL